MSSRASVFSGPTDLMAMGHPFLGTPHNSTLGIPIGIDIHTRELVYFDPWLLKDAGVINSAYGIFLGPIGHGKSSVLKILAIRLMMLSAGYQMMRIMINDYKPEGNSSEYQRLTDMTRSKVFRLASMSVNPFEARLFLDRNRRAHELGILNVAEMICEFIKESKLVGNEGVALRVAVHNMLLQSEALWSIHSLFKLLRSITGEQISAYYQDLDNKLMHQLDERAKNLVQKGADDSTVATVKRQIATLANAPDNTNLEDIKSAGYFVSTLLHRVLHGSYGHMFGDKHSLYDMLTQRAVTKDWRGVLPEAETLMRSIDTHIKVSAIENNRIDLLAHIELDDERHKSMDNIVYARSMSFFSEIARGTHVANLSATHRYSSIRKGTQGSELYNYGSTIIRNTGFAVIGKQDDDPIVLDEIRQRHQLSRRETRMLTTLPRFTFGLKLGHTEKMRFVYVFATPSELTILPTDAATDRMKTRPDVYNANDIERFARENGIAIAGMPT